MKNIPTAGVEVGAPVAMALIAGAVKLAMSVVQAWSVSRCLRPISDAGGQCC